MESRSRRHRQRISGHGGWLKYLEEWNQQRFSTIGILKFPKHHRISRQPGHNKELHKEEECSAANIPIGAAASLKNVHEPPRNWWLEATVFAVFDISTKKISRKEKMKLKDFELY